MKQYQNWLAHYLVCRRDGDHAMAADLAHSICLFWQARDNATEQKKWEQVWESHLGQVE
ncbi:hypothetical protein [Aeromonas sp. Y318-1]|uniref:hypothetical protein n=1 Tax=Aeromonas TaxID=642 RepID=UPI0022E10897|nr:hypothetical protein [Aeromonas sp. Y318-1]